MPWRTVDGVNIAPKGSAELETLLKGLFDQRVFLDLVQNFTVFEADSARLIKKIAAYHQYHAVNKAVECTVDASSEKESVRAKIRVVVKRVLRKYGYPPDLQDKATQTVLEQAALLSSEWSR